MSRSLGGTSLTTRLPMLIVPPLISSSPAIIRKQGRLAAAGRPHQDAELAVVDVDVDAMDDLRRPIYLLDLTDGHGCQVCPLLFVPRRRDAGRSGSPRAGSGDAYDVQANGRHCGRSGRC